MKASTDFERPGDHVLRFAGAGDLDGLFSEIEAFLAAPQPALDRGPLVDHDPGHHPGENQRRVRGDGRPESDRPSRPLARRRRRSSSRHVRRAGAGDPLRRRDPRQHCVPRHAAPGGNHTGEVEFVGGGIDGSSLQLAGGILALAGPTEILVSMTVKDLLVESVRGTLDDQISWRMPRRPV
jgi:hypothetical protein